MIDIYISHEPGVIVGYDITINYKRGAVIAVLERITYRNSWGEKKTKWKLSVSGKMVYVNSIKFLNLSKFEPIKLKRPINKFPIQ